MRFLVRALNRENSLTELTLEAFDETEARNAIEARALKIVDIRRNASHQILRRREKLSLLLFSKELLALLVAGLSLVEALDGLTDREGSPHQKNIISHLSSALKEGKRFSAALEQQSDIFPPLYIGLMRSAEDTNNLQQALMRYIDYQKKIDIVKNKVINASIYPAILMVAGAAVTLFLVTFVVPKFAIVYRDSGRTLPWLSQLLLEWGRYASTYPLALTVKAFIALVFLGVAIHTIAKTGIPERITRNLPWLRTSLRIYSLSRLYLTLGMLLKGGIPIINALQIARAVVPTQIAHCLLDTESQVRSGLSFSTAMEATGLTTPISQRMLRVGERSGQLADMLTQAAQFYDSDVERFLDRFTRAFEPLLMAVIGCVVGLIVVLLYMPIFDLAGSAQ